MADLVRILESLGLENVKTYIQSGNVVFKSPGALSPTLADDIAATIEEDFDFRPSVFLIDAERLRSAIASNPFPEAQAEPQSLHFFFLSEPASNPDLEKLQEAKSPTERFHLTDRVFYLHAPDGIGRSKLAAKAERLLGVDTTARNWRSVAKLAEMAEQV